MNKSEQSQKTLMKNQSEISRSSGYLKNYNIEKKMRKLVEDFGVNQTPCETIDHAFEMLEYALGEASLLIRDDTFRGFRLMQSVFWYTC